MASKNNAVAEGSGTARPEKKQSIIYNPTFRSVVFQAVAIIALVLFVYNIVNNALTNLDARGIATGLDF